MGVVAVEGPVEVAGRARAGAGTATTAKMRAHELTVRYGTKEAIKSVTLDVHANEILALIGPSGCGKSTFLRSLNRMNDTIESVSTTGSVELDGEPIYGSDIDPVL